jgi:hypothetical protein
MHIMMSTWPQVVTVGWLAFNTLLGVRNECREKQPREDAIVGLLIQAFAFLVSLLVLYAGGFFAALGLT